MESLEQFLKCITLGIPRHETQTSNSVPLRIEILHKLFFYSSPQPHNQNLNSSLVATPYHSTPYRCTMVPKYRSTYMSKPVCGLVLLQGCGSRQWLLICNLAKGKVLTLPKILRKEEDYAKEIYLGYDPIGKQFKVLYLSMNYSRPNTNWILTLESGKRFWRRIDTQLQP
uniref:F-box associated beta-propeller type 3 domain-containing protein n=1 Tax=Brassica campestris TaxID=3711 RepID=A0A3P6BTL6_BRACM|nr:unnamed protein product [Brassica rapa]